MAKRTFADRVLAWFDQHGRKDLPWQKNLSDKKSDKKNRPYRVWISEIMLQQTQVTAVFPYYEKFIKTFPTVEKLAAAPLDEVLHLWSGLGYYARCRNLHKTAQVIAESYQGSFPESVDELSRLPGIGPSTAGAILSIAFKKRGVILDGNVKRVLGRHFAVEGVLARSKTEKHYWQLADACTPDDRVNDYTQAIMDLGATLCTRSNPRCHDCPLQRSCVAFKEGTQARYPVRPEKNPKLVKKVQMLLILNHDNAVLLQKRPASGIWGGLWSFPELDVDAEIDAMQWCKQTLGMTVKKQSTWPVLVHTFSHFHLQIQPLLLKQTGKQTLRVRDSDQPEPLWYTLTEPLPDNLPRKGLPAPVSKLLRYLRDAV